MKRVLRAWPVLAVLALALGGQVWFARDHRHDFPELDIVPPLPSKASADAVSLGDRQFYFRTLALEVQNAGDTFGRTTPLYKYDYRKLGLWFAFLDDLDARSNFVPTLASYYYSQTQHGEDTRYIVDYLESHADRDPERKWWWYTQASYIASHRLKDTARAIEVANKLESIKAKMPFWARQLPAFLHEQRGERKQAFEIIQKILDNYQDIPPGELRFMQYFIKDRLKMIDPELQRMVESIK